MNLEFDADALEDPEWCIMYAAQRRALHFRFLIVIDLFMQ